MNYLSLFSGIEAASSAWAPLGWTCVGVSEIEPFPCAVLAQRHPGIPNLGDITKITEADIIMLGPIDLVVFGSPCQDLSVAGKRKGLDGERSGLFFAAMQIIEWARKWGGCRFALWENVPGAFSSNGGGDFGIVVGQMAGHECAEVPPKGWGTEGAIVGPQGMVEWSVLDAQWFGVAQRRRRVFALADFGDWASRPPILLEPESLRGDTAPSREAGQSFTHAVAPCPTSSGRGVERTGDTRGQDAVIAVAGLQRPVRVSEPVLCAATGQAGAEITTGYAPTLNCNHEAPYVAFGLIGTGVYAERPAGLRATGGDAGGGSEHLIAFNSNAQPDEMRFDPVLSAPLTCSQNSAVAIAHVDCMPTLRAGAPSSGTAGHGARSGDCKDEYIVPCVTGRITHTLKADGFDASEDGTGRGTPIVPVAAELWRQTCGCGYSFTGELTKLCPSCNQFRSGYTHGDPVAYSTKLHNTSSNQAGKLYREYTVALDRSSPPPALLTPMQVRRLTPRECERLQAFRDDHTLITVRGKPAADGPRYKALGNSMCVKVMHWIGKQIDFTVTFF